MISTPAVQHPVRRPISIRGRQTQPMPSAHLVGVCGSGMKALAELLMDLGWHVTGSDLRPPSAAYRLMEQRGLRIHQGHRRQFVPQDVDVLVYSAAVGPENPERRLARQLDVREVSYSEMVGFLMQDRIGISIAGTHGKSTTTAMTATILADAGLAPSAVMGAELGRNGLSGWAGQGPHFVVESCEYRRSFLDLSPTHAAILGIEEDHFDCYRDLSETQTAFSQFAANLPRDGFLLIHGDCPISRSVADSTNALIETFSAGRKADWWATDLRHLEFGTRFRVFHHGRFFGEFTLGIPGVHNVSNALAAVALAHRLEVSASHIRESLREFSGIRRRFEVVGSWRGVTLVDDYAHHPTSVRATLKTARSQFGQRHLRCVFQPHQISRTRRLLTEFSESFAAADDVIVVPVYAAREEAGEAAVAMACELASRISERGQRVRFLPSLDQVISTLEDEALPGDVLLTMGAGDIDRVPNEFTRRLQRNHGT